MKRRGEAEKENAIKRIGRYQEVELGGKPGKRELLGTMRLVNCFSAWEKAQDFFFILLLAQFIVMCNACKGLRDAGSVSFPRLDLGEFPQTSALGKPSTIAGPLNPNQ